MIKVGQKFMDNDFTVHTITKVVVEYGGGFYHLYRDDNGKLVVGFMLTVAFDRLTKCGAIVECWILKTKKHGNKKTVCG